MSEQSAKSEKTPIIQDGEQTANIPINDSVGATVETTMHDKGKGVSTDSTTHDISMDEADSSSEDEAAEGGVDAIDEEDALEEINPENIITGERRTRGRNIDFVKAAKELGPDEEDEDEEDDDFEIIEDEEMKE